MLAFLALVSVLFTNLWRVTPYYNWDIIGYVGVAYSFVEDKAELVHTKTYSEIKENVPSSQYSLLIGQGSGSKLYKSAVARNPENFVQQLPFYSVKPLYPTLMLLLKWLGIDLVSASVLISQTSYLT